MIQRRSGFRLSNDSLDPRRADRTRGDELQRHGPIQLLIPGRVDIAHASAAQRRHHDKAADYLAKMRPLTGFGVRAV